MTIRYILMSLEIFMLFLFLVPLPIICMGNLAGIMGSLFLLIITARWEKFTAIIQSLWTHLGGKIALCFIGAMIIFSLVYFVILSVRMYKAQENKPENPNILVVLGCKVNGEKPSRMLRRRLDTAYDVMQEYPDLLCVVSGGQGSNENISEAQAMKNYLVEKGIAPDRIIMEDKSTSTDENIRYTFEILDEMGISRDITIVTDGFHQYRASLIAKANGGNEITAFSAYTEPRYLFTYWVREWLGLTHFYILGN